MYFIFVCVFYVVVGCLIVYGVFDMCELLDQGISLKG